jgi:ABC-type branched-subunit amino acid transport system ATPase component
MAMLTRSPWALFDEAIVKTTNSDAAALVMALKALAEVHNQHLALISHALDALTQQVSVMASKKK